MYFWKKIRTPQVISIFSLTLSTICLCSALISIMRLFAEVNSMYESGMADIGEFQVSFDTVLYSTPQNFSEIFQNGVERSARNCAPKSPLNSVKQNSRNACRCPETRTQAVRGASLVRIYCVDRYRIPQAPYDGDTSGLPPSYVPPASYQQHVTQSSSCSLSFIHCVL